MRWIEASTPASPSPLPGLHPLVGQTLLQRGITTPDAARAFLDPDAYIPAPATDLPGLSAAVERIQRAIRAREPICVWGDFDVDGQTSTTVLVQALQALGANVTYHIPVRAKESHGVNVENLARIIAGGAKLVVTCDTGITAHAAVAYAQERGVDMVITDHHELPPELPPAVAIVNPKLLPADHPLATLAGVGVAYKLAEALLLNSEFRILNSELLDLVALGLVADLALLRGDARYLVQEGLDALRYTNRLGLKVMMELAELTPANLTEEHIGFGLGPRMNALGRLGDANPMVELLTTADPVRARVLATALEGLNVQRKLLCDQVSLAAESQLRQHPELLAQPVLVLAHADWPGGVVGIAASRLVERYGKPAILLTAAQDEAKRGAARPAGASETSAGQNTILRGSARSIDGLNITAAIAAQQDLLRGFGGHPMAAGLSLEAEKLPEFRRRLGKTVEKLLAESQVEEATLHIDGWLELTEANLELAAELEKLAPFGPGNEKLVLASRNLRLKSAAKLGKSGEHLKLAVEDEAGNSQSVLWWGGGSEELPEALAEGRFDLAYTLQASDWRGTRQAQLELVDFRAVDGLEVGGERSEVGARRSGRKKKVEVVDFRKEENPDNLLSTFNFQPATFVWADGEDRKRVGGLGRQELTKAETLIVWTTPPGPDELRMALEAVGPEKVVVFAVAPGTDEFKAFSERLMGLVKFVLNKKAGQTTYTELAAATAQRVATVRLGVEWLVKRGQAQVAAESGDQLVLTAGGQANEAAAEAVKVQVLSILKETAAFRAYFQKADLKTLFE